MNIKHCTTFLNEFIKTSLYEDDLLKQLHQQY